MNFVAAVLYAVSCSALLAVALAFASGGLSPMIAAVSLSFGSLVAAGTLWRSRGETAPGKPPTAWEWAAIVTFALVTARIFLWLVFYERAEAHADLALKVLSPNNLGDLSLHLTYIHNLAGGVPFWPDNPIFTGGKLTYTLGADLFNSLLTLVGVDTLRGLIWTGLAGSALLGTALWKWGRGFAVFGFLANGGLFGFAVFSTGELADFQSSAGCSSRCRRGWRCCAVGARAGSPARATPGSSRAAGSCSFTPRCRSFTCTASSFSR
jgi:hypothetical protein